MAKLACTGRAGQNRYMAYIAAGLVKQEMQTAVTTLMTALVRVDGGQKDSAIIEPMKATARNSALIKSMLSLIGSPTMLSPYSTKSGQAIFIQRPLHAN